MKKTFFSTIIILLFSLVAQAQMLDNRIPWSPEPITWNDFVGQPDPSNPFHASTSSGISYSWSMRQVGKETEFLYQVQCYFNPDRSWIKPGKNSDHLLAHEQLHFDITELHARKLRKAMEDFDLKKTKNIKPALQAIYKGVEAERSGMQKKFDAETRHSMNVEAQLEWQKFVQEELRKLEKFSS